MSVNYENNGPSEVGETIMTIGVGWHGKGRGFKASPFYKRKERYL